MTPPDPTQVDENDLNDIASMTETPTMKTSPSTAMATADMTPPDPTQVDENDLNDIANMTEAPTMNSTYFAYSTDDDIYMNATDFNNASDLLFDYEDDKYYSNGDSSDDTDTRLTNDDNDENKKEEDVIAIR